MKLINNWRNKWRIKYKSKIRKEYRKEFEKKFLEKINEIEREKELYAQAKIKEIENLHIHYKSEIGNIRIRTEDYWKNLLD